MNHSTQGASFGFLIALFSASTAAVADAPWPKDLFEPPGSGVPAHVQLPPQAVAGRHRQAEVNVDLIDSDSSITLNLFEDTMLIAVRDRIVDKVKGRSVWIGHIEGKEGDSEVILGVKGKAMMGTIRVDGKVYEIRYSKGTTHVIHETDPEMTVEDLQVLPEEDGFDAPPPGDESSSMYSHIGAESIGTVIDLMVVYTPTARSNAGGADGIEAKIVNAVESANQAYIRSGIDMQLNLVQVAEVSYTESGDMYQTLLDLKGTSDGKMEAVHSWRDQYGADQVAMISTDANYCGIAYTMTSGWVSSAFAPHAFAVVHDDSRYACLSNHSFAHELGHNQGSQHNAENGSGGGAYAYSYGYRICATGGFRTVMSYSCSGAGRVGHFSNPDVFYGADVTGIDGASDNARSMNNTRTIVAGWRASAAGTAPFEPTNLAAQLPSETQIRLTWTDNSSDETGFRIQRSYNGTDWSDVASVGGNATAYTDSGLSEGTLYYYRINAYNGAGNSGYSNTVSARTPIIFYPTDVTPPTFTKMSPSDGAQVSGFVWIEVSATDDFGVASIELRIDDKAVAFSDSGSLRHKWNTKRLSGLHRITAAATDTAGNRGELTNSVTVGEGQSGGTTGTKGRGKKK